MTTPATTLTLPGYRTVRVIGSGAMGEVWEVEEIQSQVRSAIKVIHPALASHETFVRRFRREARATSRMAHPAIVEIHHFGRMPDGRLYLAMEYVDGIPVDQLVREAGMLPIERAFQIVTQVVSAIGHAHACDVVHRDLKPANMMLATDEGGHDRIKVLDFGIAKIVGPGHGETSQLTLRGEIFGSPPYMAPETWRGKSTSPAVDVYAIGCIAYELILGRPPFTGGKMDLMHQHLRVEPTPLRDLVRGLTEAQNELIMACLAKEPGDRPRSGTDLLARFEACCSPHRVAVVGPHDVTDDYSDELGDDPTREQDIGVVIDGTAETMRGYSSSDYELHRAVIRAAEVLLDRGTPTPRLALLVAKVRDAEGALTFAEVQSNAAAEDLARFEEMAHERDRALRFAVAEISFDRGRAQNGADPELDRETDEISGRLLQLAMEARHGREARLERQVALAADKARAEDELSEAVHALAAQVRIEAPPLWDHPDVANALRLIAALDSTGAR